MITVLCVDIKSNYLQIPDLDLWNKQRDAYGFCGKNPVITHAPCQQWSRMKAFANENAYEKLLAFHCFDLVRQNGGIFEHPHGSSFFKKVGVKPTLSINQSWFGFPARKQTWLYHSGFDYLPVPLNLNAITHVLQPSRTHKRTLPDLPKSQRSRMPLMFCQWLVDNVKQLEQ